ncbi:MAG: DUF4845 domain-containing protein [Alcanivoracaceae bacterium]|nr:DUF4845 domain-containing protein [Alcanivoracaceae bacterium]
MKTFASRNKMKGLSLAGWMFVLIVVVIFGVMATKMTPAYLDFNTISGVAEKVVSDSKIGLKSESEVLADIMQRLQINNIRSLPEDSLSVEKEGGNFTLTIDYEVREKLFYNVDVVMTFQREFTKDIR